MQYFNLHKTAKLDQNWMLPHNIQKHMQQTASFVFDQTDITADIQNAANLNNLEDMPFTPGPITTIYMFSCQDKKYLYRCKIAFFFKSVTKELMQKIHPDTQQPFTTPVRVPHELIRSQVSVNRVEPAYDAATNVLLPDITKVDSVTFSPQETTPYNILNFCKESVQDPPPTQFKFPSDLDDDDGGDDDDDDNPYK